MNALAAVIYVTLQAAFFFSSKFILTSIGFQYPLVFQGWHMLVGFLLYRVLHTFSIVRITSMDLAGFLSLTPTFIFFIMTILSGSWALSVVPLHLFLSVSVCIPVTCFLISQTCTSKAVENDNVKPNSFLFGISACVIVSAFVITVTEQIWHSNDGYSALQIHCICHVILVQLSSITDARFNAVDKQYYCYLFSLVMLLPASLYLEEAFEALNFPELYQLYFIGGSLVCACSGVALNFYQSRLRNDKSFGLLHHLGLALVALLSLVIFRREYANYWSLIPTLVSLGGSLWIPTYILPEESLDFTPTMSVQDVSDSFLT